MKYHSFAKGAEESKISHEIAKNNQNLTNDQKNKLNAKTQSALKTAKDAEKDYIHQLNYANSIRDLYIEGTKKILNDYQNLEQNYIEFVKEILKYHSFERNNLFLNMQCNFENDAKVKNKIKFRK